MTAAPLLSVADLKVHFPVTRHGLLGGVRPVVRAVDGVSFDLAAGETLGIVGESGCGKSTLGRAVLRLVEATGGSVRWKGADLFALPPEALRRHRRHMQIIFQDPLASLDPRMTVGRIVERPLCTFEPGLPRAERRRRVAEMLEHVGLPSAWTGRYPHELSGGQCQRVGIARAMILKPDLVVCDEPVSALDVSIQAQIVNLLMRLQREFGLSLLFVSHNLSIVRHISRRVMVLYLGKVVEIAERDAFYAQPLHPYSRALIEAVPVPDPPRERAKKRALLTGDLPSPLDPPSGCRFRTRCPLATDLCAREEPALRELRRGQFVACHHVEG